MKRSALILLAPLLLAAASAPVRPVSDTADAALERARKEASDARSRLAGLETKAREARNETEKLRAEQQAAAAAIEAAEAELSASTANLRLAEARMALARQRLDRKRAPLAALVAGLATMGRQPPILALADQGSIEEMVRVQALLAATMPVIQRRSAALRADYAQQAELVRTAESAKSAISDGRRTLAERQKRFAELEGRAAARLAILEGQSVGASDRVLASEEVLDEAGSEATDRTRGRQTAARLTGLPFAPGRPMRGDSALPAATFAYSLPVTAPLIDGVGSVNRAGIVARGIRLDTTRGTAIIAPANGKIAFAAPFRSHDGLVIIDHGGGWTSLLINISSDLPSGSVVRRGQPLGRALGRIDVELRRNGTPVSPALIAASSVPLSNSGENR
jgi:septal ring factor EnvC (AmiA/AmiB activator)